MLNLWHAGYQSRLLCCNPGDFFSHEALGAARALLLDPSAGQRKLWPGWRCRAVDGDLCESSLLGAAAAPQPTPNQTSKSLLPSTTGCRHGQEQECRIRDSWGQGAGLAGSSVRFRRAGGYPDRGWYLLAERGARWGEPRVGKPLAGTSCIQQRMTDRCLGLWFPLN